MALIEKTIFYVKVFGIFYELKNRTCNGHVYVSVIPIFIVLVKLVLIVGV